MFDLLLGLLLGAVRAERGAILLREGEGNDLRLAAARSRRGAPAPAVSRSIARKVLEHRAPLLLDNALDHPQFASADSVIFGSVRSALVVPLWSAGRRDVMGVVYLDTSRLTRAFDEEDLGLATSIANVASAQIQNARLREDNAEHRRLEHEVQVAARLQASLLPSRPPALPGWTIAGAAAPGRAVGGDYYDWDLAEEELRLAFGDVAGKGVPAALLTGTVRALVRTFWGCPDLAAAAARINQAVLENVPAGRYATAFLARLDPSAGRLTYVNAGHHAPLLVRANGGLETLPAGGRPLGLFADGDYVAAVVDLRPGDTLVVSSDGILEAERDGPAKEEFGAGRLASFARAGLALDAEALVAWIAAEVEAFSPADAMADDRTVMALKRSRRG
jgi:serine phosphatase RsbU (regulator of sigma subunit)